MTGAEDDGAVEVRVVSVRHDVGGVQIEALPASSTVSVDELTLSTCAR